MNKEKTTVSASHNVSNLRMKNHIRDHKIIKNRIVLCAVTLAVVAICVLLLTVLRAKSRENSIVGIWLYEDSTHYCFNEDGTGCLEVDDEDYEYKYNITANEVFIDFAEEALHDCAYTFEVKSDTLALAGGEGTVGGEYVLSRHNE